MLCLHRLYLQLLFLDCQKMRGTILVFLSLLVFCNNAAPTVHQASPEESKQCAPGDIKCELIAQEPEHSDVMVSTIEDLTDVPWIDVESDLMHLDPGWSLYTNRVRCWPSVGGFIIADRVHAIELDYIGLDRFHITPRSTNATHEDAFCRKLRKIGGKWWESFEEYDMTTFAKLRMMCLMKETFFFLAGRKRAACGT